jgi:hypothetical protein
MSELVITRRTDFRWQLLSTVSALAFIGAITGSARAENADRPTVWIELGTQLERVDGGSASFAPPFAIDPAIFTSPSKVQRLPRYATGGEGKLSFRPEDSDWSFSVGLRYGRSNNGKKLHQESQPASAYKYASVPAFGIHTGGPVPPPVKGFVDTVSRNDESHIVLDFLAGKDVGLGLFGSHSESSFSGGLRFAQFSSKSAVTINADPDFHWYYAHYTQLPPPFPPLPGNIDAATPKWHIYTFNGDAARSFRGLGPTVAWDSSALVAGSRDAAQLSFDWGMNAAVLFGRQKALVHHVTTSVYHYNSNSVGAAAERHPHTYPRSRSVTVPNVGGFAGLSLKFPNARISLGYRADFFFGAIDGGIDTRKTYDRAFYGPFANFSIGLGG